MKKIIIGLLILVLLTPACAQMADDDWWGKCCGVSGHEAQFPIIFFL